MKKTKTSTKMTAGAGGGMGRLEKAGMSTKVPVMKKVK